MARKRRKRPARRTKGAKADEQKRKQKSPLPEPVDVVDGVPDRSRRVAPWKYALLAAIFLAWLGFLIYCAAAGKL